MAAAAPGEGGDGRAGRPGQAGPGEGAGGAGGRAPRRAGRRGCSPPAAWGDRAAAVLSLLEEGSEEISPKRV